VVRTDLDDAEELLADAVAKVEKVLIACNRRLRTKGRADAQNSPAGGRSFQKVKYDASYAKNAGGHSFEKDKYDASYAKENRPWREAKHDPSSHGVKRSRTGVHRTRQHRNNSKALLPVKMLAEIPQEHLGALLEAEIVTAVRNDGRGISRRDEDGTPVAEIAKRERTQDIMSVLDPPVELAAFITERMSRQYNLYEAGGELVVKEVVAEPGEVGQWLKERKKQLQEDFFATLPQDELTIEEQEFRGELLRYLDAWRKPTAPFLREALLPGPGLGDKIVLARYKLLHPSVSVMDWMCHRIGGDIEVEEGFVGGSGPQFYRDTDYFRLK